MAESVALIKGVRSAESAALIKGVRLRALVGALRPGRAGIEADLAEILRAARAAAATRTSPPAEPPRQ